MKRDAKLLNRVQGIAVLALVTCLTSLAAAAETKKAEDPFAGAFFPPDWSTCRSPYRVDCGATGCTPRADGEDAASFG